MKINWLYIRTILLAGLVLGMFAYANTKNSRRIVGEPNVVFSGEVKAFLTKADVKKVLKQQQQGLIRQPKSKVNLGALENALNQHAIVKQAEVYIASNGVLHAEVQQKLPIARVQGNTPYYIDSDGQIMALSDHYTARVPLISGVEKKESIAYIYKLANYVYNDPFLKKHVTEIIYNTNNTLAFNIRKASFTVQLGTLKHMDKKLNNFKVFYQKAIKDQMLHTYSTVNLKFDKQVICTKI